MGPIVTGTDNRASVPTWRRCPIPARTCRWR